MEMVLDNGFCDLTLDDALLLDGGRNWVATIAGTVCGGATIVTGVAGLCTPEPTGATKVGGYACIVAGLSGIVWAWS